MNASSQTSVNFAPKHLSGIDVIDDAWGGLYRGGSYLVSGRAASGRGLLTLMFARTGAAFSEPTLLVSPDRQKDLMIQAASIGFNLREAHDSGIVRLLRVPPLMNLQNMGDDGVSKALWDLVTLIRRHRPTRLIMNDFMPFVAFRSFDRFRNEFIQFLEQIDSLDTTTLLVMPEPANPQSSRVIEFMASQMTGSIHIELAEDSPTTTKRRISLIPHIGHIKRQVIDYWDLEDLIHTTKAPTKPAVPFATGNDDNIFKPSSVQSPYATQDESEFEEFRSARNEPQPARDTTIQNRRPNVPPVIPIPSYPTNPAPQPTTMPQAPYQAPPQPAATFSGQSSYTGQTGQQGHQGQQGQQPHPGQSHGGPAPASQPPVGNAPIEDRPKPPFFSGSQSSSPQQPAAGQIPFVQHQGHQAPSHPQIPYQPAAPQSNPQQGYTEPTPYSAGSPSEQFSFQQSGASVNPDPFGKSDSFLESDSVFSRPDQGIDEAPPFAPSANPSSISFPEQPKAPAASTPQTASTPPAPPPSGMNVETEYTNRESFREKLQQQFSNRDVLHQPFLLLALRMDRSAQSTARPFDFDFLMDLVGEELRVQDDMLANIDLERLVVYLADSRPEEAQSFFTRLKDRLRQESPTQADHLLHSVSAIVVPDGRPFQNASEFLTYALDEA
ncbi:hypothetical protein HQ496_02620 [bacterium]|nr:hypothetical protein [bacterium]